MTSRCDSDGGLKIAFLPDNVFPRSWFLIFKHTASGGEGEAEGALSGCRIEFTFPTE